MHRFEAGEMRDLHSTRESRSHNDSLRARDIGHNDALRRLSNRLVAILHGCLRHGTTYNEATAWPTPCKDQQEAA